MRFGERGPRMLSRAGTIKPIPLVVENSVLEMSVSTGATNVYGERRVAIYPRSGNAAQGAVTKDNDSLTVLMPVGIAAGGVLNAGRDANRSRFLEHPKQEVDGVRVRYLRFNRPS